MSIDFFNLCMNNKLAEAKQLFDSGSIHLGFTDSGKRTALGMSAGRGHIDVVNWLIEVGSPLETKDNDGRTPLARAAIMDHMAVMRTLLAAGADINASNNDNRSVLSDAIANKKEMAAAILIDKGAEVNSSDCFGKTPLHHAVQNGFVNIVRQLVENGATIICHDHYNTTPAEYAKKNNRNDICSILSDAAQKQTTKPQVAEQKNTNPASETPIDDGKTILNDPIKDLLKAVQKGDIEMVRHYIEQGEVDINEHLYEKNGLYETDYMIQAIQYQKTQIIKLLLEAGFDTTHIPSAEGRVYRNSYYLSKMISTYCFHQKYAEAYELLPLFLDADFIMDLDSLKELSINRIEGYQRQYYNMIFEKCLDINQTDVNGRSLLHIWLHDYRNTFQFQKTPVPPEENRDDILIDALLASEGIDVNINDYSDHPPLYYACKYTTGRIVLQLLQMGADVNVLCGNKGIPLTQVACQAKKRDVLTTLCDFGADVNASNDTGFTLLHTACLEQDIEVITYLLEKGADVTSSDNNGNTPLHILVGQNKPNTIKAIDLLLENGADLDALNNTLRTPFFVSCCTMDSQFRCKNLPILKHLLSLGALVDSQDINESTCLHHGVEYDEINLVKFLIENGANSNIQNNKGVSPYQHALSKNRRAIISMIEKASISIDMDGDDMDAAFMRACKNGRRGVAEMLVRSGNIDVTYVDDAGRTPLHYIARMGMIALARFVIDHGVDVNYTDNAGQTALHFAAGNQQKEVFKLLVDSCADLNIADDNGVLPIHLITNRGQHDLLELLLKNGADTSIMTDKGQSLLHMACYTRSRECVRVLLEQGMNPNILDRTGVAPLVICTNINQKEIVKMLLYAGADIKAKDLDGDEAIHIATIKGFKDMLAILLENGSDVNALNNGGLAPLHLAAYSGYKDIFKFLLDNGADFTIKTGAGKSCMDIASENGQKELIELIGIIQKRRQLAAGI